MKNLMMKNIKRMKITKIRIKIINTQIMKMITRSRRLHKIPVKFLNNYRKTLFLQSMLMRRSKKILT